MEEQEAPVDRSTRSKLVWDVILFQFKLIADGFRDLLLSPISIAAGVLGLLFGRDDPHCYYRRLMRLGRRTDVWINLFDGNRHSAGTASAPTVSGQTPESADAGVRQILE